MSRAAVLAQIERWAEDLIDLSHRNRLLHFTHTRSASLEFSQPAREVDGLLSGSGWGLFLPPPPPEDDDEPYDPGQPRPGQLVVDMSPARYGPQIERGLKTLQRKAQAEFIDRGIWVLYVGLGLLRWIDVDGQPATSPLLLRPVQITQEGASKEWRIRASDDGESALNPALAVKLEKDFGIVLPSLDDLDDQSPRAVLAAVDAVVDDPSWQARDRAILTTFTFHKEVIYRDLQRNAGVIAGHDMVRLLVEGPTSDVAASLDFVPDPEEHLDERHPPEDLACVLDADATQRQCLLAARQGRSFVMDGPPGTGKSQTIANVIAQLLADGKTVLFVSEKAAALEVVQNRLTDRKLDPFVLALHSHKATRKAVAQELGRALDERPRAREAFDVVGRERLRRERQQLTAYAIAMNEVRQPLGRSLHDAVGRLSQLDDLPDLPVPTVETQSLDAAGFVALYDTADALARSWGPVTRGEDFVWRELRDTESRPSANAGLRQRAAGCREALDRLVVETTNVGDELCRPTAASPTEAGRLVTLLELVERRAPIAASWLTVADPQDVDRQVALLIASLREQRELEAVLDAATPAWRQLPSDALGGFERARRDLATLTCPWRVDEAAPSAALRAAAELVANARRIVDQLATPLGALAETFAVASPQSCELADRLVGLGKLVGCPTPPEPTWLNPALVPALTEARTVLVDRLIAYRSARESLRDGFTDAALDLDLPALRTRFTEVHRGAHKLGGAYRADKRLLAAATVGRKVTRDIVRKLDEAVAWQAASEGLARAEAQHGDRIGHHYWPSGRGADIERLDQAIAVAEQAVALAGTDVPLTALAQQIALGGAPDPRIPHRVSALAQGLTALRHLLVAMQAQTDASDLERLPLQQLAAWLDSVGAVLSDLGGQVEAIDRVAGTPLSLGAAYELVQRRAEHRAVMQEVDRLVAAVGSFAGPALDGRDPDRVEAAAAWTAEVRRQVGGPIGRPTAEALLVTTLTAEHLREQVGAWDKAVSALLGAFHAAYADDLRGELDESFDFARLLLDHMVTTSANDIDEWRAFDHARTWLADEGWAPVVEACIDRRVDRSQVAGLVERAVLQRWVDQLVDADSRLEPKRAVDRDALLADFRRLDRALVEDAAARVINTCAARRPNSLAGSAGVIRQQAQISRRHKPVRQLLTEAGEAAQRVKPCFMMSPLSVSQFLPPSLRFDAVIFDEASQVREADAVCAIYRGNQLIVAGDPKQLPPTNFFQRMTDLDDDQLDEDDTFLLFQSVLDRCKAQGFRSLPLNWHYRSRHEDLITFSNRQFYDGRLQTFPGAISDAPDLGVELFRVDGVYLRGGLRDNKIEADAVVDRVLHHRRHHPELTLGVVALSGAQQSSIEYAIEARSASEPELQHLITDDRLDGFFVKNLENVQGDERDIVILSIGYGPDEVGKFTMNFGPMNLAGGERRLNVAVTRARRRVEVVCSFRPGDIRSERASVQHLARYLDYADRGIAALALEVGESGRDAESPFEENLLRVVRGLGYDCEPQVGVAGYRIDIGVRHPAEPGSFLLGVECDGASYHSSKVARDRDRLRDEVLRGLGWRMHHIWSTEWSANRQGEIDRLRRALDEALARGRVVAASVTPTPPEVDVEEHDFDQYPGWAYAYEEPRIETDGFRRPVGEITDPASQPTLVQQMRQVVRDFGPVHRDVLVEVVTRAWGVRRAGSRTRDALDRALSTLQTRGDVRADGMFLAVPGAEVWVRVPEDEDATPRRVGHVPLAELDLAIRQILGDAGSASYDGLRTTWARLFGWRRTGADIEAAFAQAISRLVHDEAIEGDADLRLR